MRMSSDLATQGQPQEGSSLRVPIDALLGLVTRVLRRAGTTDVEASSIARHLVWCDAVGRRTQGVWRIDTLCDRIINGGIKSPCNVEISKLSATCLSVDGDDGSGHYACEKAAEAGIRVAKRQGLAALGIRNSNYCGALAFYAYYIAERGLLSLIWSNSYAKVASQGGTKPMFGTNPMAFGAPNEGAEHILVDFSTSASAGSTVRLAAENGQPIDGGLFRSAAGDSADAMASAAAERIMLPFGGAKGYALALICELLCGLIASAEFSSGVRSLYGDASQPGKNGQFMLILDPRMFVSGRAYCERLGELLTALTTDNGQTRLPGGARYAELAVSRQYGVLLTEVSLKKLRRACSLVEMSLDDAFARPRRAHEIAGELAQRYNITPVAP